MEKKIFKTIDECEGFISACKMFGQPIPDWAQEQYDAFKLKVNSRVSKSSKTPIWDTLKENYPYGVMPEEKKNCVESTVEQLLQEGEHAEEPGLLLGKIQCGKTDTFEDIIGLSFDKGVDIAIVITKGTKALVNQTIMRMKKDYRFFRATDDINDVPTINIYDIMEIGKRGLLQPKVEGCKSVIVCKKQSQNLSRLIELFELKSPFLKKKKVIIVDDEADFASRNYQSVRLEAKMDEDGNPLAQPAEVAMAKISQQIDDFRKVPEFCRYLQVTATPYCLYLQPQGELNLNGNKVLPFKPRFTCLVPTHEAYIGGKQYFVDSKDPDSMFYHLYHKVEQKCIDVLGHEDKRYLTAAVSSDNIYGLTYSLVAYFMATAIRRIQEREINSKDYKTSAIIHVEVDKKNHDWQRRIVTRLIDSIKSAIVEEDQSDLRVWNAIKSIYNDFQESNQKGRNAGLISVEVPAYEDVLDEIRNIFSPRIKNYNVQMVNSDEEVSNLLDEESGELSLDTAANIFIGGNILDRGVTIKNMLCFFYGRDPKNFQQDTVLQHARMYGARSKEDMAVMRLHTTEKIYGILTRMNELDDQLRQWFIEGKDKSEPNAVFIGYTKNIKPCASSKIKASNALMIKPQKRMLPVGFWTGSNTAIKKTVAKIDSLITGSSHYADQDADGFFEIEKSTVIEILNLIESTYVYNEIKKNVDRKNDITEMRCALEYCTANSHDKIWALHRTGRNMSRIRKNGNYIDAPDDGRTDTMPSRLKAMDAPVIMFLKQNGRVDKEEGENLGWNDAPFYWPVLVSQQNINPVMFALDQKAEGLTVAENDFLQGIDPKEVLNLTFIGDLTQFGKVGELSERSESRMLKETTAGRYIEKDENGDWKINPNVQFDAEHYHGVYSVNNNVFPFVLRPYKYMCLRNRRDARADLILMEITDVNAFVGFGLDGNGDLVDPSKPKDILFHGADIILDKNMGEKNFTDETVGLWCLVYNLGKVLKYQKCTIDWDSVFEKEPEE